MPLPHSPEISPAADENRPAKRQRTSAAAIVTVKSGASVGASIPISPNLLLSDPHLGNVANGRTPGKGSRQDSAEAEDRKGQCPIPECGRVFKDLKAHMLTHQTERPEKCPIPTCEYHLKGFARKYDKNRHTLTHYRGTMVCIFCPGSGSTSEQTFNRVDAFKKHLTVAHGVEQAPPNSRKRNSSGRPIVQSSANAGISDSVPNSAVSVALSDSTSIVTGNGTGNTGSSSDALCSTCSLEYRNPQDFYEHLDDCVLRVVQKLDPAEMYNERNLGTVVDDEAVVQALARHNLPTETGSETPLGDDDQDEHNDNSSDAGNTPAGKQRSMAAAGPQISSRRRRRNYPNSWGCPSEKMNMKKRVVCVYDGFERIHKESTIVNRDYDVRVRLADGKSYITDMEVFELNKAEDAWNGRPGAGLSEAELTIPTLPPSVDGSDLSVGGEDYRQLHF